MLCYIIDNPSGIARKRGEKQVLVNTFGFTKKCFVSVLLGPPKTYQPKHVLKKITNQKFDENSHRQSETKIAKTLLTGTKPTYDEIKKKHKKFW